MKKISPLLIGTSLIFITATGFADSSSTSTDLKSNWTCSTNASSSSVSSDKDADKQMSQNAKSAEEAFDFASKNCRDCTKITCETSNNSTY